LPAGKRLAVHRPSPAIIEGRVPAVPLVVECNFTTVAGEQMSINFIKGSIGHRAREPTVVGCLAFVQRLAPGLPGQRMGGVPGGCVPAPPTAIGLPAHPAITVGVEPVDLSGRDISVKCARVLFTGRAHDIPVVETANGIFTDVGGNLRDVNVFHEPHSLTPH
jgi:hypothetical protein